MKNKGTKKNRIIIALSVIVFTVVAVCAFLFIRTYDFSLQAVDFSLSNSNSSVLISWENDENAMGYRIYRESDGEKKMLATVVGNDSYYDEETENAKEYIYSIVSYSAKGKSLRKIEKSCIYVDVPAITGCENTPDGVVLKWSAIEKAEAYSVYRKAGDSELELVTTVTGDVAEYCDSTVILADTYYYTVMANIGGFSSGKDDEIKIDYIAAPENVSVANIVEGVSISWESVRTVEGYEIYRRSSENENWAKIGQVADPNSTGFIDNNVQDRGFYEYKVSTFAGDMRSGYSAQSAKTVFIAPTVIKGVELQENGFRISWFGTQNVDGYVLMRKAEGEKVWFPVAIKAGADSNTHTDTTVASGVRYAYSVSQVIGDYASAHIENDDSRLFIAAPELQVRNSPSGVKLTWTKAEGATEYQIFRKISDEAEWEIIEKIPDDETVKYIDEGVTYGEKMRYMIKAWVDEENESLVRGEVSLYAVDPKKPMVALTYDDGPYDTVTNSIIKTLKKNNARATFFIVGSRLGEYGDCLKRADKIGCEIANHTYEHTNLTKAKKKVVQSEISRTNKAVEAITGKTPTLVRAPGGAVDKKVKKRVPHPLINWSLDTLDWKYRNADSIISKVKSQVEDGDIVLMHDLYESTAKASKKIIPWLIEEGYQLVTVSEMMDAKGIDIKAGELYNKAEEGE